MTRLVVKSNESGMLSWIKKLFLPWTIPGVNSSEIEWIQDETVTASGMKAGDQTRETLDFLKERLQILEMPVSEHPAVNEVVLSFHDAFKDFPTGRDPLVFAMCNHPSRAAKIHEILSQQPWVLRGVKRNPVSRSRILCPASHPQYRDLARFLQIIFLCMNKPLPVEEASPVPELRLFFCDEKMAQLPVKNQFQLHVFTDDVDLARQRLEKLTQAGYVLVLHDFAELMKIWDTDVRSDSHFPLPASAMYRFGMDMRPIQTEYPEQKDEIHSLFTQVLQDLKVNTSDMPLENLRFSDVGGPVLLFPVQNFLAGRIQPYSPTNFGRVQIRMAGANAKLLESACQSLKDEKCFGDVDIQDWKHRPNPRFPAIYWPKNLMYEKMPLQVKAKLDEFLKKNGIPMEVELHFHTWEEDVAFVDLPFDGQVQEEIFWRNYGNRLKVQVSWEGFSQEESSPAQDGKSFSLLLHAFRHLVPHAEPPALPPDDMPVGILMARGVSHTFLNMVKRFLSSLLSRDIPVVYDENLNAGVVNVHLPKKLPGTEEIHRNIQMNRLLLEKKWVDSSIRPFLTETASGLRVGKWLIPWPQRTERHRYAPDARDFQYFVVDRTAAMTMEILASAVVLREPCLLEGETSTAKTSSILYLAHLLGQPVLRMNLNGQTDTSELVGRFVPHEKGKGWQWKDGVVVEAMKHGYWLILDELNLAHPEVLERLNPVLERYPSLVLSEKDGSVLRNADVHPDFRVFATMNPALYAGRSPVSPAMRDRFLCYYNVPLPTEHDIEMFLHGVLLGGISEFRHDGQGYFTMPPAAVHSQLGKYEWIRKKLPQLAKFHVDIMHAFLKKEGAPGNEPIVFTRRSLLSLLEYLSHRPNPDPQDLEEALMRYYVRRLDESAQKIALQLLQAHNLVAGNQSERMQP